MALDNTYGELSGMFCGGLSYDGYTDQISSSDYFGFLDSQPAIVPQNPAPNLHLPS
jgi:hypothetical protein